MHRDPIPKGESRAEDPPPVLPFRPRARRDFDGTLSSRYECKYLIEPELVPLVRSYCAPFLRPDEYARRKPRNSYMISSLYLDSSDLALYRMNAEGRSARYKLRVRAYDDDPATPVFFEIKRRVEGIVHKHRARVTRPHAQQFLAAHARGGRGIEAPGLAGAVEFGRLARDLRAAPVLRVRYWREAYESVGGDPVRLTFDSDVEFAVSLDGEFSIHAGPWHSTLERRVVLEIKFTDVFPSWVEGLASEFDLQRESVAKYAVSVDRALQQELLHALIPRDFEYER